MSEWKTYKIGDLADVGSSKRIFYKEYVANGIPFYRSKEIIEKQEGKNIVNELFISTERFNEIKEKYGAPVTGDLLLSSVGRRSGIPYVVKNEGDFYFKDGNLIWLQNFREELDSTYLYYWIRSRIGQSTLDSIMIGSAQKALTISGVKTLKIDLPKQVEQKMIAAVLSSLDDKIDLLHRQNTTLEAMAQTLFRQWFVEEAEDDWEEKSLDEVVDIAIGRIPPRKEAHWFSTKLSDIAWMSIKDLGNEGLFIFDTSEYLTEEAIENFNIRIIPKDTVVLSFKMTVGRVGITTGKITSNEAIAHFRFRENTPFTTEYLYFFLKLFKYQELGSTSSIVTSINSRMIRAMEIPIPDDATMNKFWESTTYPFKKIKKNQVQIRTLEKLRDTLLPKLMSGKVRVRY